jgi:hypothetical protein
MVTETVVVGQVLQVLEVFLVAAALAQQARSYWISLGLPEVEH